MACAVCSRRFLLTSTALSARFCVSRRFASPQLKRNWARSLAPFTTHSTLSAAADEHPEVAAHTPSTHDSTNPGHESNASLSTKSAPDAEPALGELQKDLGLANEQDHEQDQDIDSILFELTGRRPGIRKEPEKIATPKEEEDASRERENIIAQLVMGKIEEKEANERLEKLESKMHNLKAPKNRSEDPKSRKPVKGAKRQGGKASEEGKDGDKAARKDREHAQPEWKIQKEALKKKFEGASWRPAKRVSPDAVLGIRDLHISDPKAFNVVVLADRFKISKEAVRRILKSKFTPSEEEMEDKRQRWERRGESVWKKLSDTGVRPPKKWREMGVSKGPAPWKKGKGRQQPQAKEVKYAWTEEQIKKNSLLGRIE